MNINSSGLSALFTASESIDTALPSSGIEGITPENFAEALKNQIKQLTNMKEIAGQLSEEGLASEFSAFFGNLQVLFRVLIFFPKIICIFSVYNAE